MGGAVRRLRDGARTTIDEFVGAGEQKWGQSQAVVLLLPHGYEGQGPDHSSARIERFLTLCAQDNMQVTMPTRAAQLLPSAALSDASGGRKPLIVFTPKSLLRPRRQRRRRPNSPSGAFQPMIGGPAGFDPSAVRRVVLCSGKFYYDLAEYRAEANAYSTAIVRIEQLYTRSRTSSCGPSYPGVPGRCRARLGAGRAGEPGRLAADGAAAAAAARPAAVGGHAARELRARVRLGQDAQFLPP